jgi:hypothetical protein
MRTFVNGVLEATIQAPPREVSRGGRLKIAGGEPAKRESDGRTVPE